MPSTTTENLGIPLLQGTMHVAKECINDALKAIDKNALNKTHAEENLHWPMWQPETAYGLQDIFKTTTTPSWAFWEVTTAGTSGTTEPTGYGEGDTRTDGSCRIVLRRLGKGGGISPWAANTPYARYEVVRHQFGLYICLIAHTSTSSFTSDLGSGKWKAIGGGSVTNWATATAYESNQLVNYNNDLYLCLADHTSDDFQTDLNGGYWKLVGKDAVTNWVTGKRYTVNELVNESNKLYLCVATHTSGIFEDDLQNAKWIAAGGAGSGGVTNWITNKAYAKNELVNYSNSLYMCLINHTSGTFATDLGNHCWLLVNDGNSGSSSSSTPVGAQEWLPNTGYYANNLVTHNGNLYICLAPHTSSNSFENDLGAWLWKQLDSDQTVISTPSGYAQITKRNVTAPIIVDITINNIPSLCVPPIEVLKLASGGGNQDTVLHSYDAADADQWAYNKKFVDINGTLTIKTTAIIEMTNPVIVTDGTTTAYISESEEIDPNDWKNLKAVNIS